MVFSRFSHRFTRGDTCALFHSLRLKPVFLSASVLSRVEAFLESDDYKKAASDDKPPQPPAEIASQLDALRQNKIIVDSPEYDDQTIGYFRGRIGLPYVEIIYFLLSDRCNFDCRYCFVKRDRPPSYVPSDMSWETAKMALDMFCRLVRQEEERFEDEKTITFYGGEPLLNDAVLCRLAETILEYKEAGKLPEALRSAVVTNGSLMTPEIAKCLATSGVSVAISVDGDEVTTNSDRRYADNRPVYRDILRAIDICRAEGVDLSFSVTLTERSLESPEKTLDTLLNRLGARSIGFNMLLTDKHYTVPDWYDERAAAFLIRAYKVFREKGIYEDRMMRKVKSFVDSSVYYFDCGACGGNQIVVAPDGQVGICHGFLGNREYFVSHVTDEDFDPRRSTEYLEWNKRSPVNMPECQDCTALGMCGGGCPLNAYRNHDSIWQLDDRFCAHAKMTLEWLIWDLYDKSITGGDQSGAT